MISSRLLFSLNTSGTCVLLVDPNARSSSTKLFLLIDGKERGAVSTAKKAGRAWKIGVQTERRSPPRSLDTHPLGLLASNLSNSLVTSSQHSQRAAYQDGHAVTAEDGKPRPRMGGWVGKITALSPIFRSGSNKKLTQAWEERIK